MTTVGSFQIETDNIDLLKEILTPLVKTCLFVKTPSDTVHLWLRHDTPPTRGWHDGSSHFYEKKVSVVELEGKYRLTSGQGYVYHGAPFIQVDPKVYTKEEAAKISYETPKKGRPSKLWVCSAGLWAEDGGSSAIRLEDPNVLIDGIIYRLKDAAKNRRAEARELDEDEYFDGSVGIGYRIETYEFAFTQINASLVKIEYAK